MNELELKPSTIEDAKTKEHGVVKALNRAFREESIVDHYIIAGSWAKDTTIKPPNDIDICFILPDEVFEQFDAYSGNKQSQLLNHVKTKLSNSYPQTTLRQDGQVVVVDFNSIKVEIIPSFINETENRGLVICDTNDGGRWKWVDPVEEQNILDLSDNDLLGNHRKLTRIFKQWQQYCSVDIKSFHLEYLIGKALSQMTWGRYPEFWFDWIVRDIFKYMIEQAGGIFLMPGGFYEWINLGDKWKSKAESAHKRAIKACEYERDNYNSLAGEEWQKIFGTAIPLKVT